MPIENFVPISTWGKSRLLGVLKNEASVNLLSKVVTKIEEYPKSLSKLTDEDTSFSIFSASLAGKLGIIFGSVEGSFMRKIVIQEYGKYIDIFEGEGKVRWGISIRWISNVKILNVKAKLSNLSGISAYAELGYVEASSRFHVKGINSSKITNNFPTEIDLSTETYIKMKEAFKAIKGEIWADDTKITPTILGVYSDVKGGLDNSYQEALIISWTLNRIKEGRTLKYAVSRDPIETPMSRETIKSVYIDIANVSNQKQKPSNRAKEHANNILGGITVKK